MTLRDVSLALSRIQIRRHNDLVDLSFAVNQGMAGKKISRLSIRAKEQNEKVKEFSRMQNIQLSHAQDAALRRVQERIKKERGHG